MEGFGGVLQPLPHSRPLIYIDSGVLRSDDLLRLYEHDRDVRNFNDCQIHFSYLVGLEWTGFDWFGFLLQNGAEARIRNFWRTIPPLEDSDGYNSENSKAGVELFTEYIEESVQEGLTEKFSTEFRDRFIAQRVRASASVAQAQVAPVLEIILFQNGILPRELALRFLVILTAQSAFAPETLRLEIPLVEKRKLWSQSFLVHNLVARFSLERRQRLAYLWPLYLSVESFRYGKKQAVDIEFYDALFFGLPSHDGLRPALVYTKEGPEKLAARLQKISAVLLRAGGDILRRQFNGITTAPIVFGEVVSMTKRQQTLISAEEIFAEVSASFCKQEE